MTRRRTARDFQLRDGATARRIRDMVRRMIVTATGAVRWSLGGHMDERAAGEVFSNIGFSSRPAGEGAEAIVLTVEASANHQVIVATRDRAAERAAIEVAGLGPGETLVFNTGGNLRVVKLTATGEVLIGVPGGTFQKVALADHTHEAPAITGQAQYVDPDARTGPPDKVSEHVKVT